MLPNDESQKTVLIPMTFYLIENRMGFESIIKEGTRQDLEAEKQKCESEPHISKIGSHYKGDVKNAKYYITPKEEWDNYACPIIPVDLS